MRRMTTRAMRTVLAAAWCAAATASCAPAADSPQAAAPDREVKKASEAAMKNIDILDETFREALRKDSAVEQICRGLKFTEGPVWMKGRRCLLFSDIPADAIYQWSETGGRKVFRKPSHNANGNTVDRQGRLVTCEHGSRTVTRTDKNGKVTTLAATYGGKKLNSPNDAAVDSDGSIWFTDPPYGIGRKLRQQKANYVFRLDAGAAEPVAVADDFNMPNGLCFSPDGKHLYVADSGRPHHIRRLPVLKGKRLGKGKVFAVISPGVPDGIRVDTAGRLYSTAGAGVQVFSPAGKLIGRIRTPQSAANCCFGGAGDKTLFITARNGGYRVRRAVGGAR